VPARRGYILASPIRAGAPTIFTFQKVSPRRGVTAPTGVAQPGGHRRKGVPMTTIASYVHQCRPPHPGRRLAAATLFAAAVAVGAAPLYPAIAGAEPPVTPAPGPGSPVMTLAPDLPPGRDPVSQGGSTLGGTPRASKMATIRKSGAAPRSAASGTAPGVRLLRRRMRNSGAPTASARPAP
jgi:hypothetical protein